MTFRSTWSGVNLGKKMRPINRFIGSLPGLGRDSVREFYKTLSDICQVKMRKHPCKDFSKMMTILNGARWFQKSEQIVNESKAGWMFNSPMMKLDRTNQEPRAKSGLLWRPKGF